MSEFLNFYNFTFISFFCAGIVFSVLYKIRKLRLVDQAPWWRNKSIKTDICYVIFNPVFKIYLSLLPVAVICLPMFIFVEPIQIYIYLLNGYGPLSKLSSFNQCIIFVIIVDFLAYWNHRQFHRNYLWPLHAVHHGPHDVDWTTAYRFHPMNLMLGSWLIVSIPILLGISPTNIIPATVLDAIMAYFVHSNLNITLGPFKYIVSTPVFHRWHHTHAVDGGKSNFGSIFSIWDIVFGTFYFPKNRLPEKYGIQDCRIEENFISQLIYPLKIWYGNFLKSYNYRSH